MAFGKMRNKQRPSSGSYASTVTTVVFIALCVLGVWMLTSDTLVSPQTTIRTSTSTTGPDGTVMQDASKPLSKPFEDNPGDLPDDATKTGDPQKPLDDQGNSEMQENAGRNVDGNAKGKENAVGVDPNAQDLGGKESREKAQQQNEHQTKISEESAVVQKEKVQQSIKEENTNLDPPKNEPGSDQESKPQDHPEERKEGDQSQQNPNDTSDDGRKQKDDTLPQVKEEPQQDPQQQQQAQLQDDKAITFTDETKKELPKEENKEDDNIKPAKENTDQQEKPASQQQDGEAAQQQEDTQRDSDSTNQVDRQDATTSTDEKPVETNVLPNTGIPKESMESKRSWNTQAAKSKNEKQRRKDKMEGQDKESLYGYTWQLCNVTAGFDYIPCLDNEKALKKLRTTKHFEHRERHCPEDPPTCLVPLPPGYKKPIPWPQSRDKIWFHNVPHTELAEVKGHQNWVKVSGEFLTFPGGGTQFIHGALHYIDYIEKAAPGIKWGKRTRVVLDVGCGVASFGGYLFEKDVLTMSFAPKDEHEAQVQFALERGIPAISAVMGTQRLPFPSGVFDVVHCARCRVPWHAEGGRLLLELNRVLRPGGYFIWSATPVYQKLPEDVEIWEAMSFLTASMCWKLEKTYKDTLNKVGAAIYRKPTNNNCYEKRPENVPPMCKSDDDPNAAWYVPLHSCMHQIPTDESVRGSKWPLRWPRRVRVAPYWLNKTQMGIYGKPAPEDFERDYEHWQRVVNRSYLHGLGISWSNVRNVMDMRAAYGGFAAALKDLKVWVVNVVNVNAPDTLPIIYERGLFGIYHDWCESFSTYPRTYDLLHADHLFSKLKERCKLAPVMAEIDRILRPGGKLIVRDESAAIGEVENLLKSLHWEVHLTFSKDREGILSATKSDWRPTTYAAIS